MSFSNYHVSRKSDLGGVTQLIISLLERHVTSAWAELVSHKALFALSFIDWKQLFFSMDGSGFLNRVRYTNECKLTLSASFTIFYFQNFMFL